MARASPNLSPEADRVEKGRDVGAKLVTVAPSPILYSLELVAEHATAEDCWSIVGDSVYDLTDWIAAHPGGAQRIISMCGNDSTSDYENQHAGQRSPTATLDRYVIGTLGEPVS